jgi:leucyl-tRNA synthetase
MKRYDPSQIEPKWQQTWAETKLYAVAEDPTQEKFFMLTEFPYPSGDGLHAGHIREYTIGDVVARHKRMQGFNVLYPMGFDEFGLPTENFAVKHKIAPQLATARNVANFRKQFDELGFSFDWSRTVSTSDPSYYRWTQWLFLQFLTAGLAYQAEIAINWCPFEKTGLANEEVVNGKHERCGTPVEKKLLKQWILKITAYADRLIEGLSTVDYPDRIASQQINWIGRSEGAEISFTLDPKAAPTATTTSVTVYTTRPDTLYGATFLVIAPELAQDWMIRGWSPSKEIAGYVTTALSAGELARQESKDKTGVDTGLQAVHPLTGKQVPVWIADYVLAGYGTGAIMAVPAHDERDFAFATNFNLPVQQVVESATLPSKAKGKLINSAEFDGLQGEAASHAIIARLVEFHLGEAATKYKLRDWVFSRQHYWGEPIPIIHCPDDGVVPVPTDQLPVVLPEVASYEPTDSGESPLAAITEWVNVPCPTCGKPAKRETDTMPNWAGSSWYYLRYMDPHNDKVFASPEKLAYWSPVDLYLGGMEHTTLHLLYSRFWHQFLYDQGLVPTPEPYAARRGQGIVLAADGRKMSKSLGNVINPSDIVRKYGADTLRLYVLFMAPYDETTPWSDERLGGVNRFIYRVWGLTETLQANNKPSGEPDGTFVTLIDRAVHKTIKQVHDEMGLLKFNTAISSLMSLINVLTSEANTKRLSEPAHAELATRTLRTLVLLLAPFTPYLSEELWQALGNDGSVHVQAFPAYDPALIKDDIVELAVQVNGKLRGTIIAAADATEAEVIAQAKANPNVDKFLIGTMLKTIVVPRRLVNFVMR